jgi:putative FmdB family regulatory protein
MPTYEYRCKDCGHEFEAVQAFTDDPLEHCPECEGPIRKLFGAVGISFKGSGFYKTDSRSGSSSSKNPASASTASPSAGESGTGSGSTTSPSTSPSTPTSTPTSTPAAAAAGSTAAD